jgi:hypothetical protein
MAVRVSQCGVLAQNFFHWFPTVGCVMSSEPHSIVTSKTVCAHPMSEHNISIYTNHMLDDGPNPGVRFDLDPRIELLKEVRLSHRGMIRAMLRGEK